MSAIDDKQYWEAKVIRFQDILARIYREARQPDGSYDFSYVKQFRNYWRGWDYFGHITSIQYGLEDAWRRYRKACRDTQYYEATGM